MTNPRPKPILIGYPPELVTALVAAGRAADLAEIDRLTDLLVQRGYCRPRDDVSEEES